MERPSLFCKCLMSLSLLIPVSVLIADHYLRFSPGLLPTEATWRNWSLHLTSPVTSSHVQKRQCHDVLRNMLNGRWHQHKMTMEQIQTMKRFHKRVREEEHHIPKGVQRTDLKCGNVSVGTTGTLHWFRGLCDTDGDTPCCFHNVCWNKTMEDCQCPNCFDMRTPINAEYATWRPVDPSCEPRAMSVEEICRLLENATVHFIGDSLVRHVFTAFLLAIRGDDISGAFRTDMPKDLRSRCAGMYMFTEKVCRLWLDGNTKACDGRVSLRNFYLVHAGSASGIHKAVLDLQNKTRSFVFVGLGFHDHFNIKLIQEKVLQPLLSNMKLRRLVWPKMLWATVHKFGMMRTPLTTTNSRNARHFNQQIQKFLEPWNVSVFDTFNFTDGVVSFDGQHYGFGVNSMKVRILLNYIQELKDLGQW